MAEIDLNRRIRKFLRDATRSIGSRDYRKAIEKLKSAENLDPDNPEILYNIGICYCQLNNYTSAIQYFQTLLSLPFTFVEIITVNKILSYTLIRQGELKQAAEYIHNILKLVPNDTVLLNMIGYSYEKMSQYQDAISVYKKIIEIDRKNYNACNSIAYILACSESNLDEALKYAKIAHEARPENPAYCDTIGYVYLKRGNLDLAKKNLKKALSKMPHSEEIKGHLNELLKIEKS